MLLNIEPSLQAWLTTLKHQNTASFHFAQKLTEGKKIREKNSENKQSSKSNHTAIKKFNNALFSFFKGRIACGQPYLEVTM